MKLNLFHCRFLLASLFNSTIILVGVDSFTTARRFELDSEEIPVHVELVNRKRVRRHVSSLSATPDFEYHLKISPDGDHSDSPLSYDLKLQPLPHSVFSPGFKYTEFDEDESGNLVTRSFVPSRKELDLIESKLYTDKDTKSFVRLEQDEDGELELYGVVDRARIRTRRDAVTGKNSFSMKHPTRMESIDVTPPDLGPDDMNDVDDDLEIPSIALPSRRTGGPIDLDAWINLEPELAVILEYNMAQQIGGDWNRKLEYAAITVNGVNGHYELTNSSIRIKCELVHVIEIKTEAQQQFLTKVEGTRVDLGGGKWTTEYDAHKVSKAYKKWAFLNAKGIGQYDIAPLFLGVKFINKTGGVASAPGACAFHIGTYSLATPVCIDRGANFEGIHIMAHEIGHNLGAPHDGEPAKKTVLIYRRSTEECPFEEGFLMGYNRKNYTNGFHFSTCSLNAIKEYVTLEMATCLRPEHKTGRPIIHTSTREGGNAEFNPYDRDAACGRESEFQFKGIASYQIPDRNCRVLKCEAKIGNVDTFSITRTVPARYTPCGDNQRKGKCRNGFCIGQGPAVDMDSVCKIATRFAGSEFDSESRPLHQICSYKVSKSWSCSDAGGRVRTFTNVTVVPGTPCGNSKVCFKQECVEKDKITDPNKECILQTGKQEAKQVPFKHPDPKCAGLVNCTYGTEFEFVGAAAASNDPDCNPMVAIPDPHMHGTAGDRGHPESRRGGGDQESADGEGATGASQTARTLQDVCDEKWTKEAEIRVKKPASGDRNELCSKLVCVIDEREEPMNVTTPDGIICGPLRRCKNGECVTCSKS